MLEIELDRSNPAALHLQVATEIRRAIAAGEARPGDRLPAAVDFATYLDVNKNTVLRALRLLRDEGILELSRGRGGVRVVGTPARSAVLGKLEEMLSYAKRYGYKPEDVAEMIHART
jgi:DNA-binding transcriptional regulator YhcF (GntR family)